MNPPCMACAHCGIEPDDMDPTCHHPKAGTFGRHVLRGRITDCGPEGALFEQHPGRTPEGYLKQLHHQGPSE